MSWCSYMLVIRYMSIPLVYTQLLQLPSPPWLNACVYAHKHGHSLRPLTPGSFHLAVYRQSASKHIHCTLSASYLLMTQLFMLYKQRILNKSLRSRGSIQLYPAMDWKPEGLASWWRENKNKKGVQNNSPRPKKLRSLLQYFPGVRAIAIRLSTTATSRLMCWGKQTVWSTSFYVVARVHG